MDFLLYGVAFIAAFFIVVLVHEAGHYIGAILFNVKIARISIGFGKPIYRWKKKESSTEYVLAPILVGGYVKLLNTKERKLLPPYVSQAFNDKPVYQKLIIILLGPISNIIFAFLAFWMMFVIGFELPKPIIGKVVSDSISSAAGMNAKEEIIRVDGYATDNWNKVNMAMFARIGDTKTMRIITSDNIYYLNLANWHADKYNLDPLRDLGIVRYEPLVLPIINKIAKGSPAQKYGLMPGDKIVKFSGKDVDSWKSFIEQVQLNPEKQLDLSIERDGELIDINVISDWRITPNLRKIGVLGVSGSLEKILWPKKKLREYKYGSLLAIDAALEQMGMFFRINRIIFEKMLVGKISFSILGGPIAVFIASGQALEKGIVTFLGFLGMISLSVAMVNLLPLPGLDLGHSLLILYERIMRRPFSARLQTLIFRLGIICMILLITHATINDLIRIFV